MRRRDEVEILLKAGQPKNEVARLTRVSFRSVQRIAKEVPVDHIDATAEQVKRPVGRPSLVEHFRKLVVEVLQEKADLPSREVLRRVREKGIGVSACFSTGTSLIRRNAPSLSPRQ